MPKLPPRGANSVRRTFFQGGGVFTAAALAAMTVSPPGAARGSSASSEALSAQSRKIPLFGYTDDDSDTFEHKPARDGVSLLGFLEIDGRIFPFDSSLPAFPGDFVVAVAPPRYGDWETGNAPCLAVVGETGGEPVHAGSGFHTATEPHPSIACAQIARGMIMVGKVPAEFVADTAEPADGPS